MGWTDPLAADARAGAPPPRECELDEELNFHLEMEGPEEPAGRHVRAQARRTARVESAASSRPGKSAATARGVAFLQNLARDLRYGSRVL